MDGWMSFDVQSTYLSECVDDANDDDNNCENKRCVFL